MAHSMLALPLQCRVLTANFAPQRRRTSAVGARASSNGVVVRELSPEAKLGHGRREVCGQAKLKLSEASTGVENGQIRAGVEIPVTCYQLLGVTVKAEKDEIVKAAMELKNSDIEDGYTADVILSRQDLLMDVRDKLLFEPEYAGNVKEKILPKSSLRMPWSWLTGALCLLQEVGEEQLVLEIGRAAVRLPDAAPYIHDLLLSMALAECSIAKLKFEKNKVSEGFEALARAQYLLRSRSSLEKLPLLLQIEESLEELAPACTLELLGMPQTPDNAERRQGAIAALRELLRQGLDVESSCRVQDWSSFLGQAMKKLLAVEIVDLLPWDTLVATRKNKKSLESQSQRVVLDFNCFYMAMIAHIALGFSTRQAEMISKAKAICECLVISEGIDLKFEDAFCSFLLGQGSGTDAYEKLRGCDTNGAITLPYLESKSIGQDKDKDSVNRTLETWLKDSVLCLFLDTRECTPSLANFFSSPRRIINGGKRRIETMKSIPFTGHQLPTIGLFPDRGATLGQAAQVNRHLGEAVKQLAPSNLESELNVTKIADAASSPSLLLKRNGSLQHSIIWKSWNALGNIAEKLAFSAIVGTVLYGTFKVLNAQFGGSKMPWEYSSHSGVKSEAVNRACDPLAEGRSTGAISRKIWERIGTLLTISRPNHKHSMSESSLQNPWPADDMSASSLVGTMVNRQKMALEEAEELVKLWQDVKAEALGPSYKIHMLADVLGEPMLSKWMDLASSAKGQLCFWRFVLLNLSILHAEIMSDDAGDEMAEIVAVLEEAADLVDQTDLKRPSYYSTYKVHYILQRQEDGSWRFCNGSIESQI